MFVSVLSNWPHHSRNVMFVFTLEEPFSAEIRFLEWLTFARAPGTMSSLALTNAYHTVRFGSFSARVGLGI